MIEFDRRQFEEYARAVFTTDSPSGCTADAIALIKSYVEELGYTTHVHNKGTLEVNVPGLDESKTVATSAHVDTLGMMVRSVKSGGTLALTKVGGPICPTLDGEYCTVLTREGRRYSGTILSLAPAVHVYPDAATMPRDADHLEVRLDEEVKSAEDVKALGIDNGDFVFIDPKFTMHDFRMVNGPARTKLIFDVVVPFGYGMTDAQVREKIETAVTETWGNYSAVVKVDHDFCE